MTIRDELLEGLLGLSDDSTSPILGPPPDIDEFLKFPISNKGFVICDRFLLRQDNLFLFKDKEGNLVDKGKITSYYGFVHTVLPDNTIIVYAGNRLERWEWTPF